MPAATEPRRRRRARLEPRPPATRQIDAPALGDAFTRLFSGAVAGKLLGIVRELALAASFGTGITASGLRAAQTATLIPAQFATGEALSAGLVPLWARYQRDDPNRGRALFRAVSIALLLFSTLATALIIAAAAPWARFLFPGFDTEAIRVTTRLLQVMALGIPFYVQSAVFWYWEMAHGGYGLAAARPTFQNVGMTAGIGVAVLTGDPVWLAWGFTGAYVLLCLLSPLWLARTGVFGMTAPIARAEVWRALREFGAAVRPLLVLPLLFQAGIAIERALASLIDTRTVASLDYARIIVDSGLALVALPLGLASLAELGRATAEQAKRRMEALIPLLLAIALPVSAALVVHAAGVIHVLYARGAFDAESVRITAWVLAGFAVGLWAQVAAYVLGRTMSAQLRNAEMVRATAAGLATVALVQIVGWRSLGGLALGLGVSAGAVVQLVLFSRALDVHTTVARSTLRMLPLVAVYAMLALLLTRVSGNALLAASFFLLYWGGITLAVPAWRARMRDILARIAAARRNARTGDDSPYSGLGSDAPPPTEAPAGGGV